MMPWGTEKIPKCLPNGLNITLCLVVLVLSVQYDALIYFLILSTQV